MCVEAWFCQTLIFTVFPMQFMIGELGALKFSHLAHTIIMSVYVCAHADETCWHAFGDDHVCWWV